MPFTKNDLQGELPQADLDALIGEAGGEAEVDKIVAEAERTVDMYSNRYDIDLDWKRSLVRSIAIFRLYRAARTESVPQKRKEAFDTAMNELRDLRDGRFDGSVPVKADLPERITPREGAYGSQKPLKLHATDS